MAIYRRFGQSQRLTPAPAVWLALTMLTAATVNAQTLPPPIGPETPKVEAMRGDDGIYHQKWFVQSFLDLREDYAEAEKAGKRFAVVFEQRGCIYCTKMHTEVLALKYINDYVRENFHILQLDLWGCARGDRLRRPEDAREEARREMGRDVHPDGRVLQGRSEGHQGDGASQSRSRA